MNRGVELLLARMDSHPEEFWGVESWDSRWSDALIPVINRAQRIIDAQATGTPRVVPNVEQVPFLSDDEVLTVYRKFALMQGDLFTNKIMQKLLEGDMGNDVSVAAGMALTSRSHPKIVSKPAFTLPKAQTK